jgi:hypothetical protein
MALGWAPHGNMVIAAHFDQRGVFVIEYYQPMMRHFVPIEGQPHEPVFVTHTPTRMSRVHPKGCTCGLCDGSGVTPVSAVGPVSIK